MKFFLLYVNSCVTRYFITRHFQYCRLLRKLKRKTDGWTCCTNLQGSLVLPADPKNVYNKIYILIPANKVTLTQVRSDENITTLKEFRHLLQTSMGPTGSAKLLVTGGGIVQLPCSTGLLERLELENPICRCIGHAVAGQIDFGLYTGVMTSRLLEQFWAQDSITNQKLSKIVSSLLRTVQELLTSELVCRKVDFSSISSFLPLVKTIITSKSATFHGGIDVDRFSFELVKVFVKCIDEQTSSIGKVYVKVGSGLDYVSSHNGLLYEITESADLTIAKDIVNEVGILVFTLKLENQHEEGLIVETVKIIAILEQAITLNVKIIACQKTVADEIKLYLRRKKVVLLERMGTDLTSMLVYISHAFPISQLNIDVLDVHKLVGKLSSVQHIQFNDSDYMLLQNKDVPVGTLLVQNGSLVGTDHLKGLARRAIAALRTLAINPTLTLGAGCLEIWLIAQINLLKKSQMDKDFRSVSLWVQRALLSACGPVPPDEVDSVYHHGWRGEADQCNCGLVTRVTLQQAEGVMIPVTELTHTEAGVRLSPPRQPSDSSPSNTLVDVHQQKLNVIISALEMFTNLSDIGMVVYKS